MLSPRLSYLRRRRRPTWRHRRPCRCQHLRRLRRLPGQAEAQVHIRAPQFTMVARSAVPPHPQQPSIPKQLPGLHLQPLHELREADEMYHQDEDPVLLMEGAMVKSKNLSCVVWGHASSLLRPLFATMPRPWQSSMSLPIQQRRSCKRSSRALVPSGRTRRRRAANTRHALPHWRR